MSIQRRIVGVIWILSGVVLLGWALWELVVAVSKLSIPPFPLVLLAYGLCGAIGGLLLYNGERVGRNLVAAVALVGLLYAALLMLIGGVGIALSNQPGAVVAAAFCVYSLVVAIGGRRGAV